MKFETTTMFTPGDEAWAMRYERKKRCYVPQKYTVDFVRVEFAAYKNDNRKCSCSIKYTLSNFRIYNEFFVFRTEEECQEQCDLFN